MPSTIQLDSSSPLAEALATAFEANLREARQHADHAIDAPHASLRGYRLALRRADALLDLCAPCLRKRQREWLGESISRARRRTRLLRDLGAVGTIVDELEALESFAQGGEPDSEDSTAKGDSEARYDAVRALIAAFRHELATTELVAWRLRKNLRSLAGLSSVFRAALGWVDEGVLLEVLRQSYRVARAAMKEAARKGTAEAINDFRCEARTLLHQLDLLASAAHASDELKAAADGLGRLVSQLSALTDIFALRVMVLSANKATLGQSPKKLAAKLDALARSRTDEIFSLAAALFAARPKDFLKVPDVGADGTTPPNPQLAGDSDDFAPAPADDVGVDGDDELDPSDD